jgi:hypothetical protein
MVLITVFPFVAKKIVVSRYFCVYIPFVILTVWTFASDLLSHFSLSKKTIAWLVGFGLCANFFVGPALFTLRLRDVSWSHVPLANFAPFEESMAHFPENAVIATNNPWRMMLHHPSRNLLRLPESFKDFQEESGENQKIDAVVLFGNIVDYQSYNAQKHLLRSPRLFPYPEGKILVPEGYESWDGLWGAELLSDDSGNRFEKVYEEKTPSMQMFIYRRLSGE